MNLLKFLISIIWVIAVFSSVASAGERINLDSPFSILEYNTFSNDYQERATFILLDKRKKGKSQAWIQVDLIHKTDNAQYMNGLDVIKIKQRYGGEYIAAIDKFLKWEEIAKRDQDNFSKEIEKVDQVKFTFVSGSSTSHYLMLEFCAVGTCIEPRMYLDRENAIGLKDFLVRWDSNGLDYMTKDEIDEKYK